MQERNIKLNLKTVVLTINKHELGDMEEFARKLQVDFRYDPIINPRLDGSKEPCKMRLTPKEVVALEILDEERTSAWRDFYKLVKGAQPNDYLYQCGAGNGSFNVDPYGRMQLCVLSRVPSYDLKNGTFEEGWRDFIPKMRSQKYSNKRECTHCKKISLCGRCPGWARLENQDQESRVDYLCDIAELRSNAFGDG